MTNHVLSLRGLERRFGGLVAVSNVSFDVRSQEIVALIGPNGAGKTTVFNVVTGIYPPTAGDVLLLGESLVDLRPDEVATLGVARTFQNVRLFGGMTVEENVLVGRHARTAAGLVGALLNLRRHRREEADGRERAAHFLSFVGLAGLGEETAENLPYGHRRRLEIARALATEPRLLLLDEPAAGLNPAEKVDLMRLIRRIRDDGHTILLIEHDMRLVMGISDRIVVLDHGERIAEGVPEAVRRDPRVVEAYLGPEALS